MIKVDKKTERKLNDLAKRALEYSFVMPIGMATEITTFCFNVKHGYDTFSTFKYIQYLQIIRYYRVEASIYNKSGKV